VWQRAWKEKRMQVDGSQFDPLDEMYAVQSAAKSEGKKEDEHTRRRLQHAAPTLAGEDEDCVVKLSGDDEGEQQAEAQDGENEEGENPQEEAGAESGGDVISDYA
jgi:hypothetical protein